MKFILKNVKEDGGCKMTSPKTGDLAGHLDDDEELQPYDYIYNFYDANASVRWEDVVQVRCDTTNAAEIQCPICMEPLKRDDDAEVGSGMVCPRITKCGHIYCWPCVLQYLDFERERSWKRCPLCFDSIYKPDLKNVVVKKSQQYSEG